jgi:hypothetical protein
MSANSVMRIGRRNEKAYIIIKIIVVSEIFEPRK